MKLSKKALPVLAVLQKLNAHFGKLYCFPSQAKILELLEKFCSHRISRRQLNYDLAAIESYGLIKRIRRHRRTKLRGMEFRSTLYEITYLGYNLMMRSGLVTWKVLKAVTAGIAAKKLEKKKPCAKTDAHGDLTNISEVLATVLS